jgi:phosphoglycolate phosphatase
MADIAIWFDIDGTILDTGGAGSRAYGKTVRDFFGIEADMKRIHFAWATDLGVLEDILTHHGKPEGLAEADRFFAAMESAYEEAFAISAFTVYSGVRELLQQLDDHPGCLLGLVTGNAEKLAYAKLRQVQLDHHFDHGGFGDDHADRNEMARLARERALALNQPHPLTKTFIIGDTPRDIAAAHAVGAVAIGVSTGGYSADDLHAAGADLVWDSFADTAACMALLTNETHAL